jgi:protein O-mannosyl-transferase
VLRMGDLERRGPAVAAGAAAAAHVTGLGGGFIWLDHAHIEEGLAIAEPSAWPSLFVHEFAGTGFYRPLVALSLSIDAAISNAPGFFKAVTLGWHAAASYILVLTARELGQSARAAMVAGLLFAVHPATSLVASAIAFRSEAMMTAFLFGLIIAHLRQKPLVAALCLAAGALTKETAWVLGPLFVGALEVGRLRGGSAAKSGEGDSRRPGGIRALVAEPQRRRVLTFEVAAFSVCTVLRLASAPHFRASMPRLPLDEAIGSRLGAIGKGALLVVAPWDVTICDAFPVSGAAGINAIAGACALAGAILIARRRGPTAWLFALALLPSLQIVPVMRWWSPHYFYLAFALGAMLLADAVERRAPARMKLLASLAVPLGILSLRDGGRYASDTSLWEPEVRAEPACREGHFFLGEVARESKDWEVAASHYERAARPVPGYLAYADEGASLQNLGAVRIAQGRWSDAKEAFASALERIREPGERRRVIHNLAVSALESGDPAEAARLLEPEMNAERPIRESLLVRAKALHQLGRDDEARAIVERLMHAQNGP